MADLHICFLRCFWQHFGDSCRDLATASLLTVRPLPYCYCLLLARRRTECTRSNWLGASWSWKTLPPIQNTPSRIPLAASRLNKCPTRSTMQGLLVWVCWRRSSMTGRNASRRHDLCVTPPPLRCSRATFLPYSLYECTAMFR